MNPSRQSRNAPAAVAESARGTAARAHQNPGSRRRSCHSVGDGRPTARCLVLSRAQPGLWAARCRGASHWVVLWCDRRVDHGVDRQAWRGSSFERGAFQLTPGAPKLRRRSAIWRRTARNGRARGRPDKGSQLGQISHKSCIAVDRYTPIDLTQILRSHTHQILTKFAQHLCPANSRQIWGCPQAMVVHCAVFRSKQTSTNNTPPIDIC
jgi:hypothetical protein